MYDLAAFQRAILDTSASPEEPHGITVNADRDESHEQETTHRRLPNSGCHGQERTPRNGELDTGTTVYLGSGLVERDFRALFWSIAALCDRLTDRSDVARRSRSSSTARYSTVTLRRILKGSAPSGIPIVLRSLDRSSCWIPRWQRTVLRIPPH